MLFSKNFTALVLTFRALIYFELILIHDVRKGSNFNLLHVTIQLSQHHLLKIVFFLHRIFLIPLSKSVDCWCADSFLDSQLYSIDLNTYSCANTVLFWLPLFCSKSWNQEEWIIIYSSFSRLFDHSDSFAISTWVLESSWQYLSDRDCA